MRTQEVTPRRILLGFGFNLSPAGLFYSWPAFVPREILFLSQTLPPLTWSWRAHSRRRGPPGQSAPPPPASRDAQLRPRRAPSSPSRRRAPSGRPRVCSAAAPRLTPPRRTCARCRKMLGTLVWTLVAGLLLALPPGRAAVRAGRRPARPRGCADRPEELLEQLYGRLAAGVLSAFHHTLQLGPREQARNASCPAGGRPAERRFRPPANLRSVSPWAYRFHRWLAPGQGGMAEAGRRQPGQKQSSVIFLIPGSHTLDPASSTYDLKLSSDNTSSCLLHLSGMSTAPFAVASHLQHPKLASQGCTTWPPKPSEIWMETCLTPQLLHTACAYNQHHVDDARVCY
ncbi:interleukin-17D isoform X1 [Cavia porcellus]|uniref:interleukin-17D isoform X1 n=1 Tax=Cavia porcellus TaxID=10141 RepID=UPI002FDF1D56